MSSDTTPRFPDRPWSEAPAPAAAEPTEAERGVIALSGATISKLAAVVFFATAIGIGVVAQDRLAYSLSIHHERDGLMLWGVALLAFLSGLLMARGLIAGAMSAIVENAATQRALSVSTEAVIFTAVLATGIFFRFWRVNPRLPPWDDAIPRGLNHDAAFIGLYGIKIHQHPGYTWLFHWMKDPYVTEGFSGENIFHYLVATSQYIFGNTEFAIQFAALFAGVATLVAFYLLIRRLFDARLALIGTFLLGASGWHYTLSKVGWPAILVPLFMCLIFYFLVKAMQENRSRDFVLAGICLGLGLDTYNGGRIFPFMVGAYLLYELVRTPSLIRTHRRQLGLFALAAVISFAPLGIWALQHPDDYTARAGTLWIGDQIREAGSLEPLWTNIKNALLMFNFRANGDDFFVNEPLLDMPVSVFFVFGLVYSVFRFRQRGHFLMLMLLLGTLAVGVASKPNGNRNIAAVIPTTAFAAIFLFECWNWLSAAYARQREVFTLALLGALMFTGWVSYDNYLGPSLSSVHFARQDDQWGFYPEATRVGHYMHGLAKKNYVIHAAAGNWPRDALTYLSYPGHGNPLTWVYTYTVYPSELLSVPPEVNRGTAYIVENTPDNAQVIALLQQQYPKAETDNIYYPDGTDGIIAYGIRVPPGEEPAPGLVVIPGAAERDAERTSDLQQLVTALAAYRAGAGAYPETSNNIQTACVYQNLDKLCGALNTVDLEVFLDPRHEGTTYGYWYRSAGTSFTLFAIYEGGVPANATCSDEEKKLIRKPGLACVHGGG